MAQTQIPQFGQWGAEGNVPYTLVFEKVRKGKNGKQIINPNDPQENANLFPDGNHSVQATPKVHDHEVKPQKPRNDSYLMQQNRQNSTDSQRTTNRINAGRESPVHPNFQRKPVVNVGTESPSWERKSTPERERSVPPRTPGRTRFDAPDRGDETPGRVSALPKFGEWDLNNASSEAGYTVMFDKVRQGRANPGKGNIPSVPPSPTYDHQQGGGRKSTSKSMKSQVISWFKKMKSKLFG